MSISSASTMRCAAARGAAPAWVSLSSEERRSLGLGCRRRRPRPSSRSTRPSRRHKELPGLGDGGGLQRRGVELRYWPCGGEGIFYSYAYPSPPGFGSYRVIPGGFDEELGEFVLPYPCVKQAWIEYLAEKADPAIDRVEVSPAAG
jgi:hypothetical protein